MSMPPDLQDCYRLLELEPGASIEEIQRALREFSKTLNPNRFGNDQKRRRRAEEKLRQINLAYERLIAESAAAGAPGATSPTPGKPVAVGPKEPSHWRNPWWYTWILAVVLTYTFLGVDSVQRLKGIDSISGPVIANAPMPAKDPTSLTGYYGNQHVRIMPALGTDGYHWIMQTERIVAGKEDFRLRHTDYDGLNDGREVHWSSSLHWLAMGFAYLDHLITGQSVVDSLPDVMPWSNTAVLVALILIIPAITAWRFGWAPAALLSLCFVTTYPYYEFSFIGYFDHHGLAASADMLMVFFLVGAGAGCLRDPEARTDRLTPAELALWKWLPDRAQAKRWMIASAVAGGTGLWVSTASIVPVMFGIGVGALAAAFALSFEKKKTFWRMDASLWRYWGIAGACSSLFFYALEYLPNHFSWRLEVNHPLYALAWFGGGDVMYRLCSLIQGDAAGTGQNNPGRNWGALAADLAMLAVLPFAVVVFGPKVFVIPDKFLLLLHKDYILEFRTFIFQMSFLQPVQVAGGISMLPLVCIPGVALLFYAEVLRPWKAVLLVALLPSLVMLLLALVYIRWLGIDCAVCVAMLTALTLVVNRSWSDHTWGYIFLAIILVVLAGVPQVIPQLVYHTVNDASMMLDLCLGEAILVVVGLTAFAIAKLPSWKTYLVFGVTALWQIFCWGWLVRTDWGKSFIANNVFLMNDIMKNPDQLSTQVLPSMALGILVFLLLSAFTCFPAILTGVAGMVGFNWKGRETARAIFLGLFVYFLALVVIPFPLFTYLQWVTTRWTPLPSDLDLTQAVTRDVSYRLRTRLGNERGVIISGPTTTTWMMYFGGFKGIGTLYWENIDGLKATADIYSSTPADAYTLIKKYGVTHIAIFSWDAFAEEYARLAKGLNKRQDAPAGAFILDLLNKRSIPAWLRPLPYRVPDHPKLRNSFALIFEVVPEQTLEEAQTRIAEWMIGLGTPKSLDGAEDQLGNALSVHPGYVPALAQLAVLQNTRGQTAAFHDTIQSLDKHTADFSGLKLEDRLVVAIAYYMAGNKAQANAQIEACVAMADETNVRKLSIDRMVNFLELIGQDYGPRPLPPIYHFAMGLLPPVLQAQVMTERASGLFADGDRKEAVAIFRDALAIQPDFDPALVNLSRILSTVSDPALRNGKESLELAKRLFDKAHADSPTVLDLLACASAEAGNFDDAQFYESKAVQLAQDSNRPDAPEMMKRLQLFNNHQTFHEQ